MSPCIPTGSGFICQRGPRRRRCSACRQNWASFLCDYRARPEGKTCDRSLCDTCRVRVSAETDYCPKHAQANQVKPLQPPPLEVPT